VKRILYILLIGLTFFAPVNRLEIAKLEPIEAVAVEVRDGEVILKTDTERQGRGATVTEALTNLKENAPAVVYLDTARYLLLAENAAHLQEQIVPFLRGRPKVAPYSGGEVGEELKYLQTHWDPGLPGV